MALVLKDRVLETTTSTGTGTITLAGAVTGFQGFSAVGDGNTCYYTITGGAEWEVGIGTYTSSGTTLSRDSVLESSNNGNLVNFSAGTKNVFVTYPAESAVTLSDVQTLTNKTISMAGLLTQSAGADIASASTVDLTTATGNCPKITGTTAVEAWTMNTGQQMKCIAGGALPLTYHATTNNIEGGASYTCAVGDIINLVKGLDGVVRVRIDKQDGTPIAGASSGQFYKIDPTTVAFTKTGAGTASIKAGTKVDVAGITVTFASDTVISMPTLTAGTDYAIWVKDDATIVADASFSSAPGAGNWRKIGGFHYAPGGNATAQSGGNTTPQINEYSFWDLKFRPACSDPRGMTLVAGGFWVDIYLTGVDAITNGSSKYNVTMADGSSPPKVPTMFGGNGSTTYGSYTWFEAQELATAFGKRTLTQMEFMSAMYGTTEASSVGPDQVSTILNAAYTSKWGVIQATGVLWVWGRDRGGPFAGASWNANTEGRGSEYNAPNAALFGGDWDSGSLSGSRCSLWTYAASLSTGLIGSRFACDHLQLD